MDAGLIDELFWPNVRRGSGCWGWTALRHRDGYGITSRTLGRIRAHRLSWQIHNGPIPRGMHVLHRCDNPPCVRPDHLFLGTHADNMADKIRKGRANAATGERHGSKTHPERVARGDRAGPRLRPETRPRGDAHGLRIHPERAVRGERQHLARLTAAAVVEIRRRHAAGESQGALAREHGVSWGTVWHVVQRKTWRHVP